MQIIVNGIITGLTLAIFALALTVVYMPTRIFHIALGGIYATVPFIMWTCLHQLHWVWYLAVPVAILVGFLLSILCELANHAPLDRKSASYEVHFISSLGIYIILVQAIAMLWGSETKYLQPGLFRSYSFGNITLTFPQVIALFVSLVTLVVFYLILKYTKIGLLYRALADNAKELALRGYNIYLIRLWAFLVSGFLGGLSALLTAWELGFDPNGGFQIVLLGVVALIVGGRNSFIGPILGGILFGIVRNQVSWYLSARWMDAVTFLILSLFLLWRPQGILGKKERLEVEG